MLFLDENIAALPLKSRRGARLGMVLLRTSKDRVPHLAFHSPTSSRSAAHIIRYGKESKDYRGAFTLVCSPKHSLRAAVVRAHHTL